MALLRDMNPSYYSANSDKATIKVLKILYIFHPHAFRFSKLQKKTLQYCHSNWFSLKIVVVRININLFKFSIVYLYIISRSIFSSNHFNLRHLIDLGYIQTFYLRTFDSRTNFSSNFFLLIAFLYFLFEQYVGKPLI